MAARATSADDQMDREREAIRVTIENVVRAAEPRTFPIPVSRRNCICFATFAVFYVFGTVAAGLTALVAPRIRELDLAILAFLLLNQFVRLAPSVLFYIPRRHLLSENEYAANKLSLKPLSSLNHSPQSRDMKDWYYIMWWWAACAGFTILFVLVPLGSVVFFTDSVDMRALNLTATVLQLLSYALVVVNNTRAFPDRRRLQRLSKLSGISCRQVYSRATTNREARGSRRRCLICSGQARLVGVSDFLFEHLMYIQEGELDLNRDTISSSSATSETLIRSVIRLSCHSGTAI